MEPAMTYSVGDHLAGELAARHMTELEFSDALGWELHKTHWLLCHSGTIETKEDAERIADVLGTSEGLWLNLQALHFDRLAHDLQKKEAQDD